MEMIAMVAFLAVAGWLFIRFVLLYKGNFLNSLFRFAACWTLIVVLYNFILKIGFPDSEFAVRDVIRYSAGDYSIVLVGQEKYNFVYADKFKVESRTDGVKKITVKVIGRKVIDIPSYSEAVLLVPDVGTSKMYKRWLLEAKDDPFVGISYEFWKEGALDKNKSAQ